MVNYLTNARTIVSILSRCNRCPARNRLARLFLSDSRPEAWMAMRTTLPGGWSPLHSLRIEDVEMIPGQGSSRGRGRDRKKLTELPFTTSLCLNCREPLRPNSCPSNGRNTVIHFLDNPSRAGDWCKGQPQVVRTAAKLSDFPARSHARPFQGFVCRSPSLWQPPGPRRPFPNSASLTWLLSQSATR